MKILIITHLFAPDRGGGASVFTDFCHGLAERGHTVDVFAGYPYYPEWKNKSGANLWKITRENSGLIKLYRHGFFIPRKPSSLSQRVAYELSFALSLLRSLFRASQCDAVIVYCPLFGSVIFAVLRSLLRREKLWIIVQDIPADAASAAGIGNIRAFKIFASFIQKLFFRRGDAITTISDVMVSRLGEILGPRRKVDLFPNWLNASMHGSIEAERGRVILNEGAREVTLLYAGNIGRKQGLLKFCKLLADKKWSFIFRIFADGSEMAELRAWLEARGDRRFIVNGFLPEQDFIKELYSCDFFVITETPAVGGAFIPSKLIPGIAVGVPIMAVCDRAGPLGSEVSSNSIGPIVDWFAIENIERLIHPGVRQSYEYQAWVRNCILRARVYSRAFALDTAEQILNSIAGR